MERKPEHTAIIARIEDMRHDLRLSKVKFAAGFGMCPQTYNNFIGQQGSKPSMELLMGVVEAYRADGKASALAWIAWGVGGLGVSSDDRLSRVEADVAKLLGHNHKAPDERVGMGNAFKTGVTVGPPIYHEPVTLGGDPGAPAVYAEGAVKVIEAREA